MKVFRIGEVWSGCGRQSHGGRGTTYTRKVTPMTREGLTYEALDGPNKGRLSTVEKKSFDSWADNLVTDTLVDDWEEDDSDEVQRPVILKKGLTFELKTVPQPLPESVPWTALKLGDTVKSLNNGRHYLVSKVVRHSLEPLHLADLEDGNMFPAMCSNGPFVYVNVNVTVEV